MRAATILFVLASVLAAFGLAGYVIWDLWRMNRRAGLILLGLVIWVTLLFLAGVYLRQG